MSEQAPVTPKLLVWARESAGFTVESAVEKIDRKRVTAETLRSWENGTEQPTYSQLTRLAYEIYKRPIAVFFFPEPPKESTLKDSFRTLTPEITKELSPNMHFLMRRAQALQISIAELADNKNPSDRFLPHDLKFSLNTSIEKMASSVREYLGISVSDQSKWADSDKALKQWRKHIELNGIFVFKDDFQEDNVSGFCLHDETFPIIYINNNKPKSRQIFTLFHELAHILFETGGIDFRHDLDNTYVKQLKGKNERIEIICNRFAGEFLVPKNDFLERIKNIRKDEVKIENEIPNLAKYYNVSREVILRKFFDLEDIEQPFYDRKVEDWNEEYKKRKEQQKKKSKTSRGDYYLTKNAYLSDTLKNFAFQKYFNRQITENQLSDYIGVKINNLQEFESVFLKNIGE